MRAYRIEMYTHIEIITNTINESHYLLSRTNTLTPVAY